MRLFLAAQKLSLNFSLHCVSPLFMVVQRKTFCVPVMSLHFVNTGLSQALLPARVNGVNDHTAGHNGGIRGTINPLAPSCWKKQRTNALLDAQGW